ncbi:sugar ABC transporter ATP-binding protein [Lichenifustis flavocetrariae]|uniref:Sugar ABC transporter ATP-binding protein n=1 Tax=Lichenifustis flavocetrariae TaxID=2949735 RepID=A0AA42CRR7_9HYPH|nr:sugar ABC transporter ATP-binding protein [Lichenifustis flavocetrariae]MCW6512767.1 sugar ABC transporter ATP-binding protein [Lichenifustis flavocetrariae]
MIGISKSFPGVRALEDVSFECRPGEVHAICGENGAGKSTLMKILGGIYRPDGGEIRIKGQPASFAHPVEARRAGIGIIHQELSLLPDRSVAENIVLGAEPTRRGVLDRTAMRAGAREILARLQSSIEVDARAGDLSLAEQQMVEIAKALASKPSILVMDEPTAALDDSEASRLLDLVRRLRRDSVAVVYVSHRMPEIAAISDRVTVLKDGRKVLTDRTEAMPTGRLVRCMVGRDLEEFFPPRGAADGGVLLQVNEGGNATISDINLTVRRGEVVGVAGLEGAGKSALARAIFGDRPFTRGTMQLNGQPFAPRSSRDGIRAGVGFLPDDRKREGLALGQSLRDNAALTLRAFARALALPSAGAMGNLTLDQRLRALDVRAARFDDPIRLLSGGNQQKVIIARWLARDPQLLIFAEPTRGIDVAAKAAIYAIIRDLANRGRGILMISSDLPEVVGVSDRVVVMHEGRIVGECPSGASEEDVMALAVGHGGSVAEPASACGS